MEGENFERIGMVVTANYAGGSSSSSGGGSSGGLGSSSITISIMNRTAREESCTETRLHRTGSMLMKMGCGTKKRNSYSQLSVKDGRHIMSFVLKATI
ncbi:hypothetical protein [Clostridium sp. chh4-2]|uniref:hypothetical protein n=1 Tax=Clostridium sp. chh4-2 TaxID=2067550 RepID=UPI0011AF8E4A|nr:hypothetical protein [Clostridium sp. chh4-2]